MAGPPPEYPGGWYRRYYGYYDRPYAGCGCLWAIIIVLIIWWIIAWGGWGDWGWGWGNRWGWNGNNRAVPANNR